MKTKKGLGRIPKSLSWIDDVEVKTVPATIGKPIHSLDIKGDEKIEPVMPIAEKPETKSTQKGLPRGWVRATFIVDQKINEDIKAFAYWERLTVKEVVHEALSQYMQDKDVKPIVKKRRAI